MQRIRLFILSVIITVLCSGCVFTTREAADQPYANKCDMSTKKLKLNEPKLAEYNFCGQTSRGADFLSCLVLAGIIVPAGSLVISGSIVLVNNSIHWLEYQGTCSDDDIKRNQIHTPQNVE